MERTNIEPNPGNDSSEAFFKAIEKIPYVGPALVFIIKKWGWSGLALFVAGAAIALALVKFHVLPAWFVSPDYMGRVQAGSAEATGPRVKAQEFNVDLLSDEPTWLKTQINLLREEGVLRQAADAELKFGVRAVTHTFNEATEEFRWLLVTESNYEITANAFLMTNQGLLRPLDATNEQHSVEFRVPKSEKGDKLIAIVRVQYRGEQPITDLRSTFRSAIKQ